MKLRAYKPEDAVPIARIAQDFEVSKWLSSVPHPYALTDAEEFVAAVCDKEGFYAIEHEGVYAGSVQATDQLGYWIGRPYWGNGLAPKAALEAVRLRFERDESDIIAYYFLGNDRSAKILGSLGFENTHTEMRYCKSQDREVENQGMVLSKARFLQMN